MNTKFEEIDGKYVATLEGEMDTTAAVEAEEVLKPLFNSNGKDVIILSGLSVGDKIITEGANNVQEGERVLFPEEKKSEK